MNFLPFSHSSQTQKILGRNRQPSTSIFPIRPSPCPCVSCNKKINNNVEGDKVQTFEYEGLPKNQSSQVIPDPENMGAGDSNRRWLFNNNPTSISGGRASSPKMLLEPIKIQSKSLSRGSGNTLMSKSNAPTLSINGLGCDIMSQINEITDGLYLCGARAMKGQRLLDMGITNVVNVTVELPCLNIDQIDTMKIQLDDSPYANLSYHFDRVADKIEEVRRKNGRTVVHCVAGVSRSTSLVLAYLMKYKKMSLRQAYNFVKARRPIIRPNVGFFRQLVEYESRISGCSSVKMVWNAAAGGYIPDVYEPEYNNTLIFLKKYGLQTADRLGRCNAERYRR